MRLVTSALLLVAATSVFAAPAPPESWGKVDVSYEQYRLDALECSSEGYDLDISKTEDAKAFVSASRRLETEIGSGVDPISYQTIVNSVRPGVRFRSIKQLQQSTVDHCLVSRGYLKFRLSGQQQSGLRKVKVGSVERHMYLYKLGSDPNVLTSQSVAIDASSR
jgi:hypothetical protein